MFMSSPPPTPAKEFPAIEAAQNPPTPAGDDAEELQDTAEVILTAEQAREVVRLIQCPSCSRMLQNPVTLPCGRSLCRRCLPETHERRNISYPATASRLKGFECPFDECKRDHALGDCGVDVTLNKALQGVKAELDRGRDLAVKHKVHSYVVLRDEWAVAGVPSLKEQEDESRLVEGGGLVAAYLMAELGDLDYHSEVTITTVARASERSDVDCQVLDRLKEAIRTEMDCQVCYALYYDPVTTECGHTFCRHCLHRVLDHSPHCPICRRQLSIRRTINEGSCPSNWLITSITQRFWSDALEVRRQGIMAEGFGPVREYDIPVFVCTLSFPAMPTFLHVFEPRYRLMIRRALDADRMFGMVLHQQPRNSNDANFTELGTLLRIVNVEFFADGRSLLETIGVSRFRILRHGTRDGYVVAKTEQVDDISIAQEEEMEDSETRQALSSQNTTEINSTDAPTSSGRRRPPQTEADLETMHTRELMDFATDFVRRMREQSVGWLTTRMLAIYGECPNDPAKFPWWFASILPVRDIEKYKLLGTGSVRERLKICCSWIIEWEASRW